MGKYVWENRVPAHVHNHFQSDGKTTMIQALARHKQLQVAANIVANQVNLESTRPSLLELRNMNEGLKL